MIYWRSVKKFQSFFPEAKFEGFENSFGDKCWFSFEKLERKISFIRCCIDNKIKILRIQ